MKPNFALNLSHDGIVLYHRASAGWHQMGEVLLDAPDLGKELGALRDKAMALSASGLACKLIIPNSQILYRTIDHPGGDSALDGAIRDALEGATPYALEELVWDTRVLGGQVQLAVIARETLEEAENFASEHAFNPVSFVAMPENGQFDGEPFFGRAQAADALIGAQTEIEPDPEKLAILPHRPAPEPTLESDPEPAPEPVPEQDPELTPEQAAEHAPDPKVAPAVAGTSETETNIEIRSEDTQDIPAPDAPPAGFQSVRQEASADDMGAAPDGTDPTDTVATVTSRLSAQPSRVLTALRDDPPPLENGKAELKTHISAGSIIEPDSGAAGAAEVGTTAPETPPEHPHVPVTSGDAPFDTLEDAPKPKLSAPRKTGPLPEPPPMPALAPKPHKETLEAVKTTAKAAQATAAKKAKDASKSAAKGAIRGISALSAKSVALGAKKTAPNAGPKTSSKASAAAEETSLAPLSRKEAGLDGPKSTPDEAEALTVFGARRSTLPPRRSSAKLGLVLTAVLIAALLLIGLLAGLMPDGEAPEQSGQSGATQQVPTVEGPAAQPATRIATDDAGTAETQTAETPNEPAAPAPVQDAPTEASEAPPQLRSDAPVPAPLSPVQEPVDLDTLARSYAATGIWPVAPAHGPGGAMDTVDTLYIASIDPTITSQDAVALPGSTGQISDTPPRIAVAPAPIGTRYDYDENGFIRATAGGVTTPAGVRVIAGRPDVVTGLRPGSTEAVTAEETRIEDVTVRLALADFAPRLRPAGLVENNEKANLGGITRAELGAFRPLRRPVSEQQFAAQEALEAGAAAPAPTAPIVSASLLPKARPANAEKLIAAARAAAEAAAQKADRETTTNSQAVAVTARVPDTRVPSGAPTSVARAATTQNAINLRKVNLIGVFGSSSDRRALVRLPSGRFVKVKVGDRLDGGRVQSISSNGLTYVKSGRSKTIEVAG